MEPDEEYILDDGEFITTIRVYKPDKDNRCPCWDGEVCREKESLNKTSTFGTPGL